MMSWPTIKLFFLDHRWIFIASLFFLIWKLLLVNVMWQGRSLPPEPDDTLIYAGHMYSVMRCPQLFCEYPNISLDRASGYVYLTYRLIWGIIGKILMIDPFTLLKVSFYVGTIVMIPALIFFLTALTHDKRLIAVGLFSLSLFHGGGGYHGFFWVAPSFFGLLLFFVVIGLILTARSRWAISGLILTTPLFVYAHPMNRYLLIGLGVWGIVYALLTWQIPRILWRNILIVIATAVVVYLPVWWHITGSQIWQNIRPPLACSNCIHDVSPSPAITPLLPSPTNATTLSARPAWLSRSLTNIFHIRHSYLNWVFPHPLASIPLLVFLYILIRRRQELVVSLFVTMFLLTAVALLFPEGYRIVLPLWVLTYLIYAWGMWYVLQKIPTYLTQRWQQLLAFGLALGAIIGFIIVNLLYSFLLADHMRRTDTTPISEELTAYINLHLRANDSIVLMDKLALAYSLSTELITQPRARIEQATYALISVPGDAAAERTPLDRFFLIATATFRGTAVSAPPLIEIERIHLPSPHLPGLEVDRIFGAIWAFRRL